MISLSKFLSDNLFLLAEVLSPAVEKIHSNKADDAGMHSKSITMLLSSEKLDRFLVVI